MDMQQILQEVREAEYTQNKADAIAGRCAHLLKGRMRHLTDWQDTEALKQIKRELRDFNAVTGRWSE